MPKKYEHPQNIDSGLYSRLPAGPVTSPDEDKLNHIEHARELKSLISEVIKSTDTHLGHVGEERKNAIALLSDYGTGKSTIYYLLKHELKNSNEFELVRLSAWKHDAGDLRIAMLRKIHWELMCKKNEYDEDSMTPDQIKYISNEFDRLFYTKVSEQKMHLEPTRKEARKMAIQTLMLEFGVGGTTFILIAFFLYLVVPSIPAWIPAAIVVGGIWLFTHFVRKYGYHFNTFSKPGNITATRELPRTSEQLEAIFGYFVREWHAQSNLIPIFFVDDIDRQRSSRVVEVLDAVRTFMEMGNCIFIVACDESRLKEAVASERKEKDKLNFTKPGPTVFDDYVQRYCPHAHRLPPFEPKDMIGYTLNAIKNPSNKHLLHYLGENHHFPLREIVEILIHDGVHTPRQANRLIDEFCAKLNLASRLEKTRRLNPGTVTSNPHFLARIVVLTLDFPYAIKELQNQPNLLSLIGKRERETIGALETYEIGATEHLYHKPSNETPKAYTQALHPELVSFVAKHHAYDLPSALPFIYLNEYGEMGAFGDAIHREINNLLTSGQVVQLKEKLNEPDDNKRRMTCEVIKEYFEKQESNYTNLKNAVGTIPVIFNQIDERLRYRIADDWASQIHTNKLSSQLIEWDIENILYVLNYISSDNLLKELLPLALGFNEEDLDEASIEREKLKISFKHLDLLKRASLIDKIHHYLNTPLANESESSIVFDFCEVIYDASDENTQLFSLFGRGFIKRITALLALENEDVTSDEETESTPIPIPSNDTLINVINKLWNVLNSRERILTFDELIVLKDKYLEIAYNVISNRWEEDDEALTPITTSILGACSSNLSQEIQLKLSILCSKIIIQKEFLRTKKITQKVDAMCIELVKSKIAWNECIPIIDDISTAIGTNSLLKTHTDIIHAIAVFTENDKKDEAIETLAIPYVFNNLNRVSEQDISDFVSAIMKPLEKHQSLLHTEAEKWFVRAFRDDTLKPIIISKIESYTKEVGGKGDWDNHEDKAKLIVAHQSQLSPEEINSLVKRLITYAFQQKGHPNWVTGAFITVEQLLDESQEKTRQDASKNILENWLEIEVPQQIQAAAVLKRCVGEIYSQNLGDIYLTYLIALTENRTLEAWPNVAHMWPSFNTAQQLDLLNIITSPPENIPVFLKELEPYISNDDESKPAFLAVQLVRKESNVTESWLGLLDNSLDTRRNKIEASAIIDELIDSWNGETDRSLLNYATKWVSHPDNKGDQLLRQLVDTDDRSKIAVSSVLKAYLPLNQSQWDSSFIDNIVSSLAESLVPKTTPETLRNISEGLSEAKLTRYDQVYAARDRLKSLRNGDEVSKELWKDLEKLLPNQPIIEKFIKPKDK
ncbi:P-loop NTPase fold protein [Gimesia maris]|uniref:P-loop NTPase fold protein n=1 Tax=Gimesia maris TaxID=122 RepID=UPI0032EAAA31